MATPQKDIILEFLERDGFVVVDNMLPPDLFEAAKEVCERAIEKGRNGEWSHLRIVGKSFPPWPASGPDIWGIQHLMHPSLNLPIFKTIYTAPNLLNTACKILTVPSTNDLQLELFNLLINPHSTPFALPYHRDTIPSSATSSKEAELLTRPRTGTQYNLALYPDNCLIVVPGSHKRPKTTQETALLSTNDKAKLPSEMSVQLKPNQAVFYENDILHRAEYGCEDKRVTLHGSIGKKGENERAKMVLQHGVEYMMEDGFEGGFDNVGRVMWKNLLDAYAGKREGCEGIHDE